MVAGNQSLSRATTALADGTASEVSQGSGERVDHVSLKEEAPGMAFFATVSSGPAATRLQRMPSGPRYRAR